MHSHSPMGERSKLRAGSRSHYFGAAGVNRHKFERTLFASYRKPWAVTALPRLVVNPPATLSSWKCRTT